MIWINILQRELKYDIKLTNVRLMMIRAAIYICIGPILFIMAKDNVQNSLTSKHNSLTYRCINDGPQSAMLSQHQNSGV